jgi:hypothetical protein
MRDTATYWQFGDEKKKKKSFTIFNIALKTYEKYQALWE